MFCYDLTVPSMPLADRDYMRSPPDGPEPERVAPRRNRMTILFRLLVIVWLGYLTVKTHDMNGLWNRSIEVSKGLREVTVEFYRSAKGVIFKED
jgi:hypothetical protein